MTIARTPLPKGFMKGGFFKWPERELVEKRCRCGCGAILQVPSSGHVQQFTPECKKKRAKVNHSRWTRKSRKLKKLGLYVPRSERKKNANK